MSISALISGIALVPAGPAAAAFSAPTAVGVGDPGNARVWTAVGTAAGSLVRARTYTVGLAGSSVDAQRWQWERVAYSETAGITFRIRNVAGQRCLDRTSAGLVINNCGTVTTQRWRAPLGDPSGGWTLINEGNAQCLSLANDPNPGALVQTGVCNGNALQRWRMRPAPQDCTIRSGDWIQTDVCALQGTVRMYGLMANWHHYPISMAWVDPEDYILSNTVKNFAQVRPLNTDGSQGVGAVELGLQADRSAQQAGSVSYAAYMQEWNGVTERYRRFTATEAPGSGTANEQNHTYMLLGDSNTGQWDLLYDYNTVATTTLQGGGTTRISRAGLSLRYPEAVTVPTPFGFRMRLMDGNGTWRLPLLAETGLGEVKKCNTPPRYEDWIYDVVNVPPNCLNSSYGAAAGATATDPPVLESFGVGKPAATAISSRQREPIRANTVTGLHNGVDQSVLAACLDAATKNCLDEVPGLTACVEARLICNVTSRSPEGGTAAEPMTAAHALAQAQRTFSVVGQRSKAKVTTRKGMPGRDNASIDADSKVHVVTSADRVHSMAPSNDKTYGGYTAVFDAASGALLQACLGAGCRTAQ